VVVITEGIYYNFISDFIKQSKSIVVISPEATNSSKTRLNGLLYGAANCTTAALQSSTETTSNSQRPRRSTIAIRVIVSG